MTWTTLDDTWDDDPDLLRAVTRVGDSAMLMWVRAVTYCNRKLTDGRIPGEKLRGLTKHRRPREVVEALVAVGKLSVVTDTDDFEIVNFLDWNLSRAAVESKRAKRAESGRKGGEAKARNAGKDRGSAPGAGVEGPGENVASASQSPVVPPAGCYDHGRTPSPSPSPSASSKQSSEIPPTPQGGTGPTDVGHGPAPPPLELIPGLARTEDPVELVWSAYVDANRAAGGAGRVLNDARRKLIRARLKDHPVDDLRAAARGVFLESWAIEHSKTEPEWVFQNAGNVERYAKIARREEPRRQRTATPPSPDEQARKQAVVDEIVREKRARLGPTGTEDR